MEPLVSGHEFLRLLDPDPERAAEKYAELLLKLGKFFEWRNCRQPEDLAQETLRRGFARMASGVDIYTADPGHYFYGIARFVAMESWKSERGKPESIGDKDQTATTKSAEQIEADICLDQCLAHLPPKERDILWRYHIGDRERLRQELGVTAAVLRVRVHRILEKVRQRVRRTGESRTK